MLNFLNLLAKTASTNDKLAILESAKNDIDKRLVFELAYNPRIKFWIKKRPESSYFSTVYHKGDLTNALNELVENIANRKLTGNAAIEFVSHLLDNLTKFDQEVLYRVIERDLKCGVNTKLINKVWKDLIPEYPVLLCGKFNEKTEKNIKYPAIFQKKEDGGRINLEFDDGKFVSATTRNGNTLDITIFNDLSINIKERCIIDGELLYAPNGIIADRKIGNGIVTKAIRNTISGKESSDLIFICWDYIPYNDFINEYYTVGYETRFNTINTIIPSDSRRLRIIESEVVYSREEVMQKYHRNLELGYEGAILKSLDGIWSSGRSKFQLKLKAELEIDLLCTDIELGKTGTKYENMLGAIICQSKHKTILVNVGTGFSDEQRKSPEQYINKIVKIYYNTIIKSESKKTHSLFLPVFGEIRYDKDEPDIVDLDI